MSFIRRHRAEDWKRLTPSSSRQVQLFAAQSGSREATLRQINFRMLLRKRPRSEAKRVLSSMRLFVQGSHLHDCRDAHPMCRTLHHTNLQCSINSQVLHCSSLGMDSKILAAGQPYSDRSSSFAVQIPSPGLPLAFVAPMKMRLHAKIPRSGLERMMATASHVLIPQLTS